MRISKLLIAATLLFTSTLHAQDRPVGQWRAHLPYNTAIDIATDGANMFVATQQAFFIYDQLGNELIPYSKVNGMSDVGMRGVAYDNITETVILTYTNSNIDLFKNNEFFNLPDLKLKTVTGSKAINSIYTEGGLAYLSTDIGIVVINLEKKEIKETYTFTKNGQNIPINGLTADQNSFYAATDDGLYTANKNSPNLQAFSSWSAIDTLRSYIGVVNQKGKIFTTLVDSLFVIDNNSLTYLYDSDSNTKRLCPGNDGVWILENYDNFTGQCKKLSPNYTFIDSFRMSGQPTNLIPTDLADSTKWISNSLYGLMVRTLKGEPYGVTVPEGPEYFSSYDIYANDKELWVAHGGYDDQYRPSNNRYGFSQYLNQEWTNYKIYDYQPFGDSLINFTNILKAPNGNIYAGSTSSGLFILKPDGSYEYFKQNSIISPSSTGGNLYRVSGFAADDDGNVWITVLGGVPNELVVHTTDNEWYTFATPFYSMPITHGAGNIIIDDFGQKWYAAIGGGGVIVFDDNRTPEDKTDDRSTQLLAGEGSGGLPDNTVYCLANDQDGAIWIGTANGIGIVNCPSSVIEKQCEAERRIVQFDDFAGYLFQNEQVKAIAVDGGNRKWIGTNNGIWLISPDGDEILERFTTDNSPLPSNIIQKITIDPVTGDVYFGTELGLMSYRGAAVDADMNKSDDLITFPNPVPSGYSGSIAIKGFLENADVRITDVSGQLVYKTTALGGQAIWNGTDYTGRRVQSGVYLIFATNRDGSETQTGKMVFME